MATDNKKSNFYKTVLLPIKVCVGNFCFDDGRACGYFNYEGGYPSCDLNISHDLKENVGRKSLRVLKPEKCLNLKEI